MATEVLLSAVITKLTDLVIEQIVAKFRRKGEEIGNDIKFIRSELRSMKAFLRDAEKRRVREEVVNEWVAQVRKKAYEVEDVLEEFLHINFNSSSKFGFINEKLARRKFHSQIKIIRKDINDISRRSKQYNFRGEQGSNSSLEEDEETRGGDHGMSNPFVEEDDIVGIDQDVNKLRGWLLKEEEAQRRSIVSVVGMGGSGKTTLVKKVYKSISGGQFDCNAWVSVSQDFQVMDLLKRIFQEFHKSRNEAIPSNVETMTTPDELRNTMNNYLEQKRYVLVLDDIWDVKAWEVVKNALPPKSGGRIIFTTHNQDVASPIGEIFKIHQVEPLPDELAWGLFCKKAFKNESLLNYCPQHLEQIGREAVKRCRGLPLAIVVIGGLMSKKGINKSEWNDVLENLDCELSNNQDLDRLNRVLLTSYNYLPHHLKYCFLYCGMFPEHYRIETSRLTCLWVAEGFIEDHPRKTLEEVAHGYLVQLIDRNKLQADNRRYNVGLVACRMHDLMRDIAIHVIKKEEFGVVFTKQSNTRDVEGQRRRIVAVGNSSDGIPTDTFNVETRSFLTFSVDKFFPLTVFKSKNWLRVFDLSGTKIKCLPSKVVVQLIHLRYLSVRGTEVNELPDSLYELQNLQTLDARDTSVESFLIYPQLRHLLFGSRRTLGRHLLLGSWRKLGRHLLFGSRPKLVNVILSTLGRRRGRGRGSNSSNLQTLGKVVLDESLVSQLCYLTQLRKLKLHEVKGEYCVRLCDAVVMMQHLRSLSIQSSSDEDILDLETNMSSAPPFHLHLVKLELYGVMKEGHLPQWTRSLKCLQRISLWKNNLMEDPLNTFAQLPNLEVLSLFNNAYLGRQIGWGGTSSSSNEERQLSFPKLKCLWIWGLPELEELSEIEEGMMRSLKELFIADCPKLKKLPHGFHHLRSLCHLGMVNMPEDCIKRLRCQYREGEIGEGEDHWMIQHIPTVTVLPHLFGDDGKLAPPEYIKEEINFIYGLN